MKALAKTQRPVVNAKAHKRLRKSVKAKCAQIGVPATTTYRGKTVTKTVTKPQWITDQNPLGVGEVTRTTTLLGNCVRNEIQSMKSTGRALFGKHAC